jgi:hypothetical protein
MYGNYSRMMFKDNVKRFAAMIWFKVKVIS